MRLILRVFLLGICILFCTRVKAQSTLLDNFNRTAGNTTSTTGLPWVETESTGSDGSKVRLVTVGAAQMLQMSGCNSDNSASTNGYEQVSLDMTGRYATVFNTASTTVEWYFNFRNSRSSPSGFGSTNYGIAFVVGCDETDFKSVNADGYAIVMGESGGADPIRLVKFQGGMLANSNLTSISNSNTADDNNYYSIHVTYNSCTKQWSLAVRDDGTSSFADPKAGSYSSVQTAFDYTYTNLDLKYMGALWQHSTNCGENARFDNFYIPTATAVSNPYVWNGTTTDYQVATNWTPSRTCPLISDVLIWNASSPASSTVTNIPTDTVSQLFISGNRTVTFKTPNTGGAKILSLTGGTGTDFQLGAGSTLTLDADVGMEINLLTGTTAMVDGAITLVNTATGSPRDHRLLGTDANSIIVGNGAVFTASDLSGSPFGNSGLANTVIFQSGSTYVSQDGANPFGLVQPDSKVVFQTGSLYKQEQGVGLQLVGRTYADLEINTASTINNLFGGAGTTCTIDNFTLTQGTLNFQLTSDNEPLNILIKGNFSVTSGAVFSFDPVNLLARSSLTFGGSTPQTISGVGTVLVGINSSLIFDNPSGITLNQSLTTTGTVQLKNGVITTNANQLYVASPLTTALTSSNGSHVNGFLRRNVLLGQLYSFFIGDGINSQRADIQFSSLGCVLDVAMRFRTSTPATTSVTAFTENGVAFNQLLTQGFWEVSSNCDLVPVPGSAYELRLYPVGFPGFAAGINGFTIAKRVGSGNWLQNGTLSNPDNTLSFIQNDNSVRRAAMSGFSNFAIVNGIQPLPVTWLGFTGVYKNGQTHLQWTTAAEENNHGFEVEKSPDGKTFKQIGFVKAVSGKQTVYAYSFTDSSRECGYYRLKQLDNNAAFEYSEIVPVNCEKPGLASPAVYPNPAHSHIRLVLPVDELATVRLLDQNGSLIGYYTGTEQQINQKLVTILPALPPGLYVLQTHQGNQVYWNKLIKQ